MRTHTRSGRRPGVLLISAMASFALIAGACSSKKDEGTQVAAVDATEAAGTATTAADAAAVTESQDTTVTEPAVVATDPATTTATKDPVPGGTLIVSGEAEVANPWTPAAMQCDSYCQERARTFYDPIAAIGDDGKVHPYLAESITHNDDFTQWTVKLRSGIKFTDGTDLNADAVIKNLQLVGSSLLISKALVDLAKVPSADGKAPCVNPDFSDCVIKVEKVDELTATIFTGKNGDPSKPLPWPGFDYYMTGQGGLIASPTWLDAVVADPSLATKPVGTGPFIVESYAPRDKLVVKKNPNYWQKDAKGNQLPYLDSIEFRVIEDSEIAAAALNAGDIDIFSTSDALVTADYREKADQFPMTEQKDLTETNYLLIDLDKKGPLQDARVRCALSKAIDRQEMIDATSGGILQPANGLFSPGQEGYLADNGFSTEQDIEGAKALLDAYKAETGTQVSINYGTTIGQINAQLADLIKGYWTDIGVDFVFQQVPQDEFITDALFGKDNFFVFGWRNHAGLTVDQQNFWWNSAAAPPDGGLALNFGRVRDQVVDDALAEARSATDPATRQAAAETVNKQMAKECYQIPWSWTIWGTPHKPSVQGLGQTMLPDGTPARDGAGFSGQFWTYARWIDASA